MVHARPFEAGGRLYVIGHDGDLLISVSDDAGSTWSDPVALTDSQVWHQAPSNVWHANGCVYLAMERRVRFRIRGWYVGELAPVLMRAPADADLTRRENWTFAEELAFYETIGDAEGETNLDYFGVPFFESRYPDGGLVAQGRRCSPIGWLETNVVQIRDPDHVLNDPSGQTLHLWMRAHTGAAGFAAIAKVVENGPYPGSGAMTTMLERAPSGKKLLFVPCPGGQMKFHIVYDSVTELFWLLSTQAVDSMRRPDRLPPDRYGLPNNERRRLVLHFSTNLFDWCFAGLVAFGGAEVASRHYAAMDIDGDDLVIVSRSGDTESRNAHDTNVVTFHRVVSFRDLVY